MTKPYHIQTASKSCAGLSGKFLATLTLNATTSLLSTGMLDREKQAKKQQDTEYEGAGSRAEVEPMTN